MSGQPTVVASRRRQCELLRSWSGWLLTTILIDPSAVKQAREAGWAGTHHRDPETGKRIVGTPGELGFGVDESWRNPTEVIPWSEVEAIAKAVPGEVRGQLIDLRERWRRHLSAYPRFTASADAVGCGPIVESHPLNPRQEAYVRELGEFESSGVLPAWEQMKAGLEEERLELHGRALAAGRDEEPVDLLGLLEDQQLARPGVESPAEHPGQTPSRGNTKTVINDKEAPVRIRNYTDHQRAALEGLRLPQQFTFICERKTAHSSERVVFVYSEGDRSDSVILNVDDRARAYLDVGGAVLVARAHHRYQKQARDTRYTDSARAMSSRAADALRTWLDTHPSLEVRAWQTAHPGASTPASSQPGRRSSQPRQQTEVQRPIGGGRQQRPALRPSAPRPRSTGEVDATPTSRHRGVSR